MNKKLITAGVAAALAAPLSALAASDVTLYGIGKVYEQYVNADSRVGTNPGDTSGQFDGWDLVSNASRLGVKGSEDLGGGLKAIFKMELQIPMTNENDTINDGERGRIKMRNSYVGLAGDWGTALAGRHDTPLKVSTGRLDLFSDQLGDYNQTVGFFDVRADSAIAYISPSFNGLTAAGAIFTPGGATLDAGGPNKNADGIADAWSVAAMYKNGPWYGSAAYEYYKSDVINAASNDDFKLWRVGFGYTAESWLVNLIYEGHKDDPRVGANDPNLYQAQAQYMFGNNAVKAMYGYYDADGSTLGQDNKDHYTFAVGLDHNFSKRTTVYVQYTDYDSKYDDSDWYGGALGMVHKF